VTSIPAVPRYEDLAQVHRPRTREGIAIAVRELMRQGLRIRDVSAAMRMSIADVHAALTDLREETPSPLRGCKQ
jgi:hypothetical protein